jgi:hypothetical protein
MFYELQAVRGISTSTRERDSSRKIVKTNLIGRVRQKGAFTDVIFFELVVVIFLLLPKKRKKPATYVPCIFPVSFQVPDKQHFFSLYPVHKQDCEGKSGQKSIDRPKEQG